MSDNPGSSLIGLDIRGIPELQAKFKHLNDIQQDMVIDDLAEYMLNIFLAYPPEKSISREMAYGVKWFSDKQRKFFFAALHRGEISVPYDRTQNFSDNWVRVGKGRNTMILNETDYGKFLMGDGEQSRHASMIGWLTVPETVEKHSKGIERKADGAVKKALKKAKLK